MRTTFTVGVMVALSLLCGCATKTSHEAQAGAGQQSAEWQVEFSARDNLDPHGYRERFEWMERARFESPGDILSAIEDGVGRRLFMSWGMDGTFVGASRICRIKIEEDETRKLVRAIVVTLPSFNSLLGGVPAEDARLLKLIHASSSFNDPYGWNPVSLIASTNALHAVGKERALAFLDQYQRLETEMFQGATAGMDEEFDGRIYALITTLFSGDILGIGPMIGASSSALCNARGPICLVYGIPFATHLGFNGSGFPELTSQYLERIQRKGHWRESPMAPTTNPLTAAREIERQHKEALNGKAEVWWDNRFVMSYRLQALRCLGNARLDPSAGTWKTYKWLAEDSQFLALEEAYATRGVHWDAEAFRFRD